MSASDKDALNKQLKTSDSDNFFIALEQCVEFQIPQQLRAILTLNLMTNAVSFSRDIMGAISEIENFMRFNLKKSMLKVNQSMDNILGVWINNQKSFTLMSGQRRMLMVISDYCQKLYPIDAMTQKQKHNDDGDKESVPEEVRPSSSKSPEQAEHTHGRVESVSVPSTSRKRSFPFHKDGNDTPQWVRSDSVLPTKIQNKSQGKMLKHKNYYAI